MQENESQRKPLCGEFCNFVPNWIYKILLLTNIVYLSDQIIIVWFLNGCNKVVIELRVVQFWSEMILVISNRARANHKYDFRRQDYSILWLADSAALFCKHSAKKLIQCNLLTEFSLLIGFLTTGFGKNQWNLLFCWSVLVAWMRVRHFRTGTCSIICSEI